MLVELLGVVDDDGDCELDDGSNRFCAFKAGLGAIRWEIVPAGLYSVVGIRGVVSSEVGVGGATFDGPGWELNE